MGTIKGSGTTIMTTIVIRNIKIGMLECHKCTALLVSIKNKKSVRRDKKTQNQPPQPVTHHSLIHSLNWDQNKHSYLWTTMSATASTSATATATTTMICRTTWRRSGGGGGGRNIIVIVIIITPGGRSIRRMAIIISSILMMMMILRTTECSIIITIAIIFRVVLGVDAIIRQGELWFFQTIWNGRRTRTPWWDFCGFHNHGGRWIAK